MTDSNGTQENESESKNSTPPSTKSLAKCAAGAIAVTMAIFFVPWSAVITGAGTVVGAILSVLIGVLSPLAQKGVMGVLIATVMTGVCFAIKHDGSPASDKALGFSVFFMLMLTLIGMSYTVDRPRSDMLRVAHENPALYKKITQLTAQEQAKLKDIWDISRTWDADREMVAELLGPDIENMGNLEYRSFRRFVNDLGHNSRVNESLPIHGCRDMVETYRQVKIPGSQLTVNNKIVSLADGPDQCKWLGFNKLNLVTPD